MWKIIQFSTGMTLCIYSIGVTAHKSLWRYFGHVCIWPPLIFEFRYVLGECCRFELHILLILDACKWSSDREFAIWTMLCSGESRIDCIWRTRLQSCMSCIARLDAHIYCSFQRHLFARSSTRCAYPYHVHMYQAHQAICILLGYLHIFVLWISVHTSFTARGITRIFCCGAAKCYPICLVRGHTDKSAPRINSITCLHH